MTWRLHLLLQKCMLLLTPEKEVMANEQIIDIFIYHKPFSNQPERYEQIRADAKVLALTDRSTP
jgi:hypothetical protein